MMYSPKKVYQYYQNAYLSKRAALDFLIFIIETSNNDAQRIESLRYINKINPKSIKIFEFLENIFISEPEKSVRFAAFKVLKRNFPIQAINPIIHIIINETGLFIIPLIEFLHQINPFKCYNVIIDKIKNSKDLSIDINNRNHLKKLSLQELITLFYNYLLNKSLESLYFHRHQIPLALDFYGMDDV
ncbi:MAG: hypothetical protein ACFFD5_00670 [Candidatus Thorarchaeota archaeon]